MDEEVMKIRATKQKSYNHKQDFSLRRNNARLLSALNHHSQRYARLTNALSWSIYFQALPSTRQQKLLNLRSLVTLKFDGKTSLH